MEFDRIIQQIIDFTNQNFNKKQKIVISVTVTFTVVFLVYLSTTNFTQSEKPDNYEVLFESLTPKDSALAMEQLKLKQIPYKIINNNIYVPKKLVYEQRISLSSKGIPKDSKVGFELFDKNSFGSTDFEQKVKYLRALEGEFSRTIESLTPIKKAIVHIAIPEKSVFVAKKVEPSASVVVALYPNMTLGVDKVIGIRNLVAAGVPELSVDNIKIVDSDGQPLDPDSRVSIVNKLADAQMKYKTLYERTYEDKIVQVLSKFVGGKDSVTARVTISFDFTVKNSSIENYDPSNIVRSEQSLEEKKKGFTKEDKGGIPGAISNIGPVKKLSDGLSEDYSKTQNTVNYEISKTISNVENEFAKIIRVHAAVVVDGSYVYKKNSSQVTYIPRKEEELNSMRKLVEAIVGYNKKRGDIVTLENFRFSFPILNPPISTLDRILRALANNQFTLKYLMAFVMLLMLYKLIIKKFVDKMLDNYINDAGRETSLVSLSNIEEQESRINKAEDIRKKIEKEMEGGHISEDKIRYDIMLEKIRKYLIDSPDEASNIFTGLIKSDDFN